LNGNASRDATIGIAIGMTGGAAIAMIAVITIIAASVKQFVITGQVSETI
jgi:hypothetical protein